MAKVLTEEPSRFQITLCGVDWPRYIKSISGLKKTSRMSVIRAEINYSDSQTSSSETLAQQITLEKDAEKRGELVMEYVALVIKEWTGISSSSEVDLNNSLYNYGIDSAGALTLKMQFESNLQVSFEVGLFKLGRFVLPFRATWHSLENILYLKNYSFIYARCDNLKVSVTVSCPKENRFIELDCVCSGCLSSQILDTISTGGFNFTQSFLTSGELVLGWVFSSPTCCFLSAARLKICLRRAKALVLSHTWLLHCECSCFRFSTLCSLIQPLLSLQETSMPSLVEKHLVNSFRISKAKKLKLYKHTHWQIHRARPSHQRVKYKLYRCTLLRARLSSSSVYIHRTAMR